jgi:uncharacterized protein YjbI with pentapeptide repeats
VGEIDFHYESCVRLPLAPAKLIAYGVYLENRELQTMDVSDYPDFSSHGYQVTRELGRNREAGRITYQATAQNLDQQVVIKEFRFALADANWSGFKAYQREIEMLQQLEHPRIPRYLDCFETQVGFCLVQEYKNAPSLVERRSFNPEDIKQIALSVLEILVYLQRRTPPIIHRDIKPENILVDKQLNAYLVDFGFARIRGGEMALSSVAAGTPGFMPPEEQFGRPLTEASDLYSLGATLICLLTGIRSVDIGTLIDDDYRFDFKKLVPKLNPRFISWLEKMVAPNVKQRFDNATVALEALKSNRVVGSANGVESLVGVVKGRKQRAVLGLATLGIVTSWVGINSILYQTEVPQPEIAPPLEIAPQPEIAPPLEKQVRQVKQFKQCVKCNLQGADLMSADLMSADLRSANLRGANLRSANLRSAYLSTADLRSAKLRSADLTGADLTGAYLSSAYLSSADLTGAYLTGADLTGANLTGAYLTGAYLRSAYLRSADLSNAKLSSADLRSAYLNSANLRGAKLRGAYLSSADLRSANLIGANLIGAKLRGADLRRADLRSANLSSADLRGADLSSADLRGAKLSSAKLSSANLTSANLEGANLENAIMPDGKKHP